MVTEVQGVYFDHTHNLMYILIVCNHIFNQILMSLGYSIPMPKPFLSCSFETIFLKEAIVAFINVHKSLMVSLLLKNSHSTQMLTPGIHKMSHKMQAITGKLGLFICACISEKIQTSYEKLTYTTPDHPHPHRDKHH